MPNNVSVRKARELLFKQFKVIKKNPYIHIFTTIKKKTNELPLGIQKPEAETPCSLLSRAAYIRNSYTSNETPPEGVGDIMRLKNRHPGKKRMYFHIEVYLKKEFLLKNKSFLLCSPLGAKKVTLKRKMPH